jgi:hypothetical protein
MGAPNRFVDRLSRVPAIYNHIGLYAYGYDKDIFVVSGVWRLLARIPGCSELVRRKKFNADVKKLATELKATMQEMLAGYKSIVLVGQGLGVVVGKRVSIELEESVKCYYVEIDDADESVLAVDDPNDHLEYNKVLALLQSLVPG